MKIGFDNEKYLKMQSEHIRDRISKFDNKLYLEFGGKLFDDYHASRVLPGFAPDSKLRLLKELSDQAEIVIVISAKDIEKNKIRGDLGITYDTDVLRLIQTYRDQGLYVGSVTITQFSGQESALLFKNRLESLDIPVYLHYIIPGYPSNVPLIISEEGYGKNDYIETSRPLVIVTAPGPGSGKMATCLSQVYHEYRRGVAAGYAKFETFPVWSLPLNHPVNIAYEAATADIGDINMVDPFHLEHYHTTTINYNRDIEIFPVVRRICERIMGPDQAYKSPTDMGVNRVGFAITDDEVVCEAAKQEIIRRYFRYQCEYAIGAADRKTVERVKVLMDNLGLHDEDRSVVAPAREAAIAAASTKGKGNDGFYCGAALQLPDGTVVTGKNSPLMHAASSCILNAVKKLAKIPDPEMLIAPEVISSVAMLKRNILKSRRVSLDLDETLIALSVSTTTNPIAKQAMNQLRKLAGCELHISHLPTPGDEAGLRKLGINLTCDPKFASRDLFVD